MIPTPVTGVSTESGPGIDTRTATSRGRSQAVSPARATSDAASTGRAIERDTSQSYRPADRASTRRRRARRRRTPASGVSFRPAPWGTSPMSPVSSMRRAEARITDLAERLRAATGAELAVVTLPTIGDRDEADVALAIGRAWGVGRHGRGRRPAAERRDRAPAGAPTGRRARHRARADRGGAGARGHRHRRDRGADPRPHGSDRWPASDYGGGAPGRRRGAGRPHRARLRRHRLRAHQRPSGRAAARNPRHPARLRFRSCCSSSSWCSRAPSAGEGAGGAVYWGGPVDRRRLRWRWWRGLGRRRVRRRRVRRLRRRRRVQRRRRRREVLMHEAVDRVVTPFWPADAALGSGYSALLYGSAARGDFVPGRSDSTSCSCSTIPRRRGSRGARRARSRRGASRRSSRRC